MLFGWRGEKLSLDLGGLPAARLDEAVPPTVAPGRRGQGSVRAGLGVRTVPAPSGNGEVRASPLQLTRL